MQPAGCQQPSLLQLLLLPSLHGGPPGPEALFAVAFLISTPAPCIRGCSNAQHHQSKLIPDVCFCSCWLLLSILLEVFEPALMRCRARRAPKLFVCHSSGSTPQSTFLSKCCFLIPAPTDNRMLCCKAKQCSSSCSQLRHPAAVLRQAALHRALLSTNRTMLLAANIHICYSVWAHYSYSPCSEPYFLPPGVLSSLRQWGTAVPSHRGPVPKDCAHCPGQQHRSQPYDLNPHVPPRTKISQHSSRWEADSANFNSCQLFYSEAIETKYLKAAQPQTTGRAALL